MNKTPTESAQVDKEQVEGQCQEPEYPGEVSEEEEMSRPLSTYLDGEVRAGPLHTTVISFLCCISFVSHFKHNTLQ